MELRHEFNVPLPVDDAWKVFLDIERVAPCMPGATVDDIDGDTVNGSVKVKVGPITLTYRGTATFVEKDAAARRLVLAASGKEVRGQGTAKATVTGTLREEGDGTAVAVVTDLAVTGRPAQFGRGVMAEVSDKLIGQFATCLSEQATGGGAAATKGSATVAGPAPAKGAATAEGPVPAATAPPTAEPIDLLRAAGLAVALAVLAVILRRRRR